MLQALKSKTILSGLFVTILGILESTDVTHFTDFVPDEYKPLFASAIGLLMIALRFLTKEPISAK